ncbi:MAG: hypothetical protein WCS42_22170, partial [Verrucomicrobiota bacterium]
GSWEPEEIICQQNPGLDSILKSVTEAKGAEYSLVYFAGHGEVVKTDLPWPETRMQLGSGQTISEREINPGSPRCTLIMDCCSRTPEQDEKKLLVRTSMLLEHGKDRAEFRNLYQQSLTAAESGLVKIIVTKVGGSAAGTHSFTQHLLNEANIWTSNNRGILYLGDAVELAKNSMKRENPQQQPEYQGGRRLRHFPFAVQI